MTSTTECPQSPWCIVCGESFDDIIETRKHIFNKHYEYALAQANGDKKQLQEWMELKQ